MADLDAKTIDSYLEKNRPTLVSLIETAESDLQFDLGEFDEQLDYGDTEAPAQVIGGGLHLMYGFAINVFKQMLPSHCTLEWLHRWTWGMPEINYKGATKASGKVVFAGSDSVTIDALKQFQAPDGTVVEVLASGVIASGSVELSAVAVKEGVSGNLSAGTKLKPLQAISGLSSDPVVAVSGFTGGSDPEKTESFRKRLRTDMKEPRRGGARHDFVAWALDVPDVTNAWCDPRAMGTGTLVLRFTMNDKYDDGIPLQEDIDLVTAEIMKHEPPFGEWFVVAPIKKTIDFTLTGATSSAVDGDAVMQAAIEQNLKDIFMREATPKDTRNTGIVRLSRCREAISLAKGEEFHGLSSPVTDNLEPALGEILRLGTVTYSA